MPVYVWFLFVTFSFNADGQFKAEHLDVFNTLGQCETVAYNLQDKLISYEQDYGAEGELHCVKHAVITAPAE